MGKSIWVKLYQNKNNKQISITLPKKKLKLSKEFPYKEAKIEWEDFR